MLDDKFGKYEDIILNQNQLKYGKEISDDIKEDIFFIYKMFGGKSFFKLREIIFSEYSPVEEIFSNTYLLYLHILYNIGVSKSKTKDWFKNNFLEID